MKAIELIEMLQRINPQSDIVIHVRMKDDHLYAEPLCYPISSMVMDTDQNMILDRQKYHPDGRVRLLSHDMPPI